MVFNMHPNFIKLQKNSVLLLTSHYLLEIVILIDFISINKFLLQGF